MHVAFNQNASCCVAGTPRGFRVYNCNPFSPFYDSEGKLSVQGIGLAQMLFSTSLVVVVGDGEHDSPRRLSMVNTRRNDETQVLCELTYPTAVRALRLNRQRLVVVLDAQIYVYNLANMRLLHTLDTATNRHGVADITPLAGQGRKPETGTATAGTGGSTGGSAGGSASTSATFGASVSASASASGNSLEAGSNVGADSGSVSGGGASAESGRSGGGAPAAASAPAIGTIAPSATGNWLVYPAGPPLKHHVAPPAVEGSRAPQGDVVVFDLDALAPVTVVRAHRSPLAALALNEDGTLLATTSDRGTLVRVFSVPGGTLLYEFRRGSYQSRVYSLAFSLGSGLLCVSSATQTVHVYKLDASTRLRTSSRSHAGSSGSNSGSGSGGGSGGDRGAAGESGSGDSGAVAAAAATAEDGVLGAEGRSSLEEQLNDDSLLNDDSRELSPEAAAGAGAGGSAEEGDEGDQTKKEAKKKQRKSLKKRWFSRSAWAEAANTRSRDFAWFKLPIKPNTRTVLGLDPLSKLIYVATETGKLFHYSIDLERGGECQKLAEYSMD